jgi:hypothetical protein
MRTLSTRWVTLRSIFAFTALLAVTTAYAQQNVNVVSANSTNNKILGVTFNAQGGGSTTLLNSDAGSLYSLQSLVFVPVNDPNAQPVPIFSFDLLAADNQKGKVLRYIGDFGSPINKAGVIVTTSIPNPTGLSADSVGDVFVLNDTPGHSPLAQVWVLLANGSGPLRGPFRVDNNAWGKQQATVESLIVGPPLGISPNFSASSGDLLVLTSNPNTVRRYQSNNGQWSTNTVPSNVLIGQCPTPQTIPPTTNCIPAMTASGSPELPGGIAIWPDDNTVLITLSTSGVILQFDLSTGSVVRTQNPFATGPAGLSKIKIGRQGGLARAFVAQSGPGNHGSIIEYGAQAGTGPIVALASVTTNVAAPLAVAATNAVQQPVNSCVAGCDLLGGAGQGQGVLKHTIEQFVAMNLPGSIVEDVCIVSKDPRYQPPPAEGCGDTPLPVNSVCPGFDNTSLNPGLVIPGYLCGHAGSNGKGFALVRSLTNPDQYDQTYVETAATVANLLPGTTDAAFHCGPPQMGAGIETFAWAPLAGEGSIIEDSNGPPVMVDITSGCGSGHGGTTHASLWAVGLALDTQATELTSPYTTLNSTLPLTILPLANFASQKYTNLTGTISGMPAANLPSNVSQLLWNNNSSPLGCIDKSWMLFQQAANEPLPQQTQDFQNAANLLTNADATNNTTCDSIVQANLSVITQTLSPLVLNPSGQIRSRLANLYYSINTLILNNPANAVAGDTWPPAVSLNADPPTTGENLSATLRWNISGTMSLCSLTSSDNAYTGSTVSTGSGSLMVTPQTYNTPVSYTITCTSPTTASATAYLTSTAPL